MTLSGGAVLVLEMAAPRLFAPWFGTSHPVWTNVIGVVLAALAAGYALGGRLAARNPGLAAAGVLLLLGAAASALGARFGSAVAAGTLPQGVDLEGVQSLLLKGSLYATIVVFGPPMVLLGMLTPVVVEILSADRRAGNAAGAVLGLSTTGSIAGTFLATHVLLPDFGTRATMYGAAGALAACGLALLLAGGRPRGPTAAAGAAALLAVLLAPTGAGGWIRPPAEDGRVEVLAEFESAYQFGQVREVSLDGGGRERLLTLNEGVNTYHSVWRPEGVLTGGRYYDLYPSLPLLAGIRPGEPLRVLVLGAAAGTQARALHHFFGEGQDLRVDAVEIDGAVVAAGRRHFDLPESAPWLRIHVMDARAFVACVARDGEYDLVLVDCFSDEYYLPFHLATEEFFALARRRLRPGGLLAYNAFAYRADDPLLRALQGATARAFGRAWRVPLAGYPNFVVVARNGDEPVPWEGFAARAEEGAFPAFAARPEGRAALALAAEAFRRAVPMDAGAAVERLTDDRAPVERLADRAVAREEGALPGADR